MKIYRPLMIGTLCYVMGIFSAYCVKDYPILLIVISILTGLAMYRLYKKRTWLGFLGFYILFLLGIFLYFTKDNHSPDYTLQTNGYVEIKGQVTKIKKIKNNNLKTFEFQGDNKINLIGYYRDEEGLIEPGNIYSIKGRLLKPEKQRNPGGFDEYKYYRVNDWDYKMFVDQVQLIENRKSVLKVLYRVKLKLEYSFDKILPKEHAAIMKTMLLGGTYEDAQDMKELFKKAGIVHILAISGLHVTMIGYIIFKFLCKTLVPKRLAYILTLVLLTMYCAMTGFSTSTVRALLMFAVIFIGNFLGRKADIYTSMALAMLVILLCNPFMLLDVGFQLSFGAVLSIVTITPLLDNIKVNDKIKSYVGASVAAFLGTWPIIAFHFYHLSTYSIVINILIVPLLGIVVVLGMLGGIIGLFSTVLGRIIIGCVYFILEFYELLAKTITFLPYASINTGKPPLLFILLYYLTGAVILYMYKNKCLHYFRKWIIIHILACGILISILTIRKNSVAFLDVGQGDCAVINTKDHRTYIIDGGGEAKEFVGKNVILPYLKYKGINKVDSLFLSHSDSDHISGLVELLDLIEVKEIYITSPAIQENENLSMLLIKATEKNISVIELYKGHYNKQEEILIKCLAPKVNTYYPSNNDSSMVLGITIDQVGLLFTGDIEAYGEKEILKDQKDLQVYSVLKVPHHGSKTSSSYALLDNIKPQVAIISSGIQNKYGHPHKEVIKRLEKFRINIYNTATGGAIILNINNDQLKIRSWLRD